MGPSSGYRTYEALKLAIGFGYPGGAAYPAVLNYAEDPTGVRPLIQRAINGDWHATGRLKKGDGVPPLEPEAIPAEWWEFLSLDTNADSASGLGIEIAGLRWFNAQAPEFEGKGNPILVTPAEAGREGGRQPKYNQALQEAVNKLVSRVRKSGGKPTARTLLDYVTDNATPYSGLELDIPNCDEIYTDGDKLVWKDRDGRERFLTKRSLDPYVKRAKHSY